jgi:hypothetical protein
VLRGEGMDGGSADLVVLEVLDVDTGVGISSKEE